MNEREALRMALEALEGYVNVVVSGYDPNEWTPKVVDAGEPARKAIIAIREVLAQPEQKPVTLQINGIPPFKNPPNDVIDAAFHVSDWAQRNNWTKWRIGNCCSCDYTTPPKRKWVWLTRMDLIKCGVLPFGMSYELCQAIESKLREKNGY